MTQYSVQPWDRIFLKTMDFCLLLKIWAKKYIKI